MDEPPLTTTRKDVAAAVARGLVAGVPYLGGLIAEVVNTLIPGQKIERIIRWVQLLDERVSGLDRDLGRAKERLRGEEGLDLFEESATQAARALTDDRREYLANLLARGLTQEEMKYAETKKVLNIVRDLTDPEIITLLFYSKTPTLRSEWHREFRAKCPEVLDPVSQMLGSSQDEVDRGALQDSYRSTLLRLGLLGERDRSRHLTNLGRLVLRYIGPAQKEDGDHTGGEVGQES